MTIDGAIIREQGVTFGIVIVKPSAMDGFTADETRAAFQARCAEFAAIPLILASQDASGRFSYQGRPDIVEFLASIDSSRIPWKRYTYS